MGVYYKCKECKGEHYASTEEVASYMCYYYYARSRKVRAVKTLDGLNIKLISPATDEQILERIMRKGREEK